MQMMKNPTKVWWIFPEPMSKNWNQWIQIKDCHKKFWENSFLPFLGSLQNQLMASQRQVTECQGLIKQTQKKITN